MMGTASNATEKPMNDTNVDDDEYCNDDTSTESEDTNVKYEQSLEYYDGDSTFVEDMNRKSTSFPPCNPSTINTTTTTNPVNRGCMQGSVTSRAKAMTMTITSNTMKRASEVEPTHPPLHGKRKKNVDEQALEKQQTDAAMLKRNIKLPTAKCRAKKRLFETKLLQENEEQKQRIILHQKKKPRIKFKVSHNNKKKLQFVASKKKKNARIFIKRNFKLPLCRPQRNDAETQQQQHPEADAICLSADKRYSERVNAALIRKEIYILTSNVSDEDMVLLKSLCSKKRLDGVKLTILKEFSNEATICVTPIESTDGKSATTMNRSTSLMLASLVGIPIASISMIKSWQNNDEITWPIAPKSSSRNRLIARSFQSQPDGQGQINMDYGIARMAATQVLPLAGYYVILAKDVEDDLKDLVEEAGAAAVQVLEPAKITERSSKKLLADVHKRTEKVVFVGSFPKKLEPMIRNENVQDAIWVYNAISSGRIPQPT